MNEIKTGPLLSDGQAEPEELVHQATKGKVVTTDVDQRHLPNRASAESLIMGVQIVLPSFDLNHSKPGSQW